MQFQNSPGALSLSLGAAALTRDNELKCHEETRDRQTGRQTGETVFRQPNTVDCECEIMKNSVQSPV